MNHDEIENLNRTIISNKIESVTKNLPKNKSQGPNSFTGEFYQSNDSQKMKSKEHFQTHSTRPALPWYQTR